MSGEQWSRWIQWNGEDRCPVNGNMVMVRCRVGDEAKCVSWAIRWAHENSPTDIIAYRYKIEEPDSNMHPNLEWLARNVSEWKNGFCDLIRVGDGGEVAIYTQSTCRQRGRDKYYTYAQWLQARKDLGLIMSDEEEEMSAEERTRTAPDFLQQAASLMQERGQQYDQPGGERSMGKTIAAFNAITGRDLSEPEGWMLMGLLKTVRQYSGDYHQDSAEDKIAYAALEAESLEASALRARELEL